jgi:hypothetical protein
LGRAGGAYPASASGVGLEAAMLGHAVADIVVHGIRPLFQ